MRVRHLFVSPQHAFRGHFGGPPGPWPMVARDRIECVAGRGIRGDRYFDYKADFKGQVTFFSWETLVRLWDELGVELERRDPAATRRNVLVEGGDLNGLIGQEFELQGVRFLGVEECRPCSWMDEAIVVEAEAWLEGRGGLRAKILTGGELQAAQAGKVVGVLLAGGRSVRMGQDKALLELGGRSLAARQLATLQAVTPRVAVAARERPCWLPEDVVWIEDEAGVEGPLAGILPALKWAEARGARQVAVLAVDLPKMEPGFLRALAEVGGDGKGAVARHGSLWEPLAAVYPVAALPALWEAARAARWKMQDVVADLVASGLLEKVPVAQTDRFFNVNTPGDLALLTES